MTPTCYVIAGANGVGKSTAAFQLVPAGVEQLNADDIARQIRQQQRHQEVVLQLTNDELQRRVAGHVQRRGSFALETNLHDTATWHYFLAFKQIGYRFELVFLSTSELAILYNRVINRHLQGGHFVREDVIRGRYEAGLHLLSQFFEQPDALTLIDTTEQLRVVYKRIDGQVIIRIDQLPDWIITHLSTHFTSVESSRQGPSVHAADTIEQVRSLYRQQRQQTDPTNE